MLQVNKTADPSTPAKQRETDQELLSDPSGLIALLKRFDNLPAYGAQHRQDAIEQEGMRRSLLYYPWELIPGCEWHVTPHGRSYFVNHNTRTTSWKKPTPERLPGSLMPECIIKCDNWNNNTLAWLGTSGNIMSTLDDGSIHQWTRDGKPVGKPFDGDGNQVNAMAMSLDETMVVFGSLDGRVRLWNVKEGSMVGNPWEGNNVGVWCLDWSPNGVEVAGGLEDGTIRRWNPATGRQIAPSIKRGDKTVWTVKYSAQGDKFASGGQDKMIRLWSKDGELLVEINGHDSWVSSLCWSKDGAHIFSASNDRTIRKWQSIDGEELVVFQGHANFVEFICLSPDGCHLVSASSDYSVRIWDLKTNQQVGDPLWHDDQVLVVAMSSDGQYFATAIKGSNANIYVWSLEAALERARGVDDNVDPNVKLKGRATRPRDISLAPRRQTNNRGLARYGNDFFGDHTNRTTPRSAERSSPPSLRNLFGFLRSSTQPSNAPRQIQLQPPRLLFGSFPLRISRRPVDVAPCRDEDRYGITPETDAEAEAAMRRTNSKIGESSILQGEVAAGRPTHTAQGQSSAPNTEEPSYLIGCCGFYLVRHRPTSN